MNKGIAHILMIKLTELPFIQLFGGLVSVQSKDDVVIEDGRSRSVKHRFPVAADYIDLSLGYPTTGLKDMTPNSGLTGLLFFEDGGSRKTGRRGNLDEWESKLRLIVWLNTNKLFNSSNEAGLNNYTTGTILNAKISKLFAELDNKNLSPYGRVRITQDNVLQQDEKIFGNYTFDVANTQYIMPPYEYFAVDYTVKFLFNPACVDEMITPRVDIQCNPVQFLTLTELLEQMAVKSLELVIGTDIEAGTIVHILRANGLGTPGKPLALSDVYVLSIVISNVPIQEVKINEDDEEALDFSDTDTGGIVEGILTITFRQKTIQL